MTKAQIAILAALIEEACQREIAEADARRSDAAATADTSHDKPEGKR